MAEALPLDRDFSPAYGRLVAVAPGIRRIVARNPGPFTFTGTGTYVVGTGRVAVIDPGPDLADHVAALVAALAGESVSHIVVTHTHSDHSGAVAALVAQTGAPTYGFGAHARPDPTTDPTLDATLASGADFAFVPDHHVADGDTIEDAGGNWHLRAIHTPGHTSNHLSFALGGGDALFSGDHVMAWSSSVILPPDGDLGAYLNSLEILLTRDDQRYWPTHGGPVREPRRLVAALLDHRRGREGQIMARIAAGDRQIARIVATIYADTPPSLHPAAAQSVLAHLIDLVRRGRVGCSTAQPALPSEFFPV